MQEQKKVLLSQYAYLPSRSACLPGLLALALITGILYTGLLFGNGLETANKQAALQLHLNSSLPVKSILEKSDLRYILPDNDLPIKRVTAVITDLEQGNFTQAFAGIDGRGFPLLPATHELAKQLKILTEHEGALSSNNSENRGLELKRTAAGESLQILRKDMYKLFRNPNYIDSSASSTASPTESEGEPASASGEFYSEGILAKLPILSWLPDGLALSSALEPFLRNPPNTPGGDPQFWADLELNIAALQSRAADIHTRLRKVEAEQQSIEARNSTAAEGMTATQLQLVSTGKSILFEIAAPQADEQASAIYLYVQQLLATNFSIQLPQLQTFE